jgi:hypothetical protein
MHAPLLGGFGVVAFCFFLGKRNGFGFQMTEEGWSLREENPDDEAVQCRAK